MGTLFLCSTTKVSAQSGPVECKIQYDYDVAGNRIKRQYKCEATWTIADPLQQQHYKIFSTLFPNPTTGDITGIFSEPLFSATFLITASNGSVVQQHTLQQQATMITFNISAQVPGTYFLTAWALGTAETYTIIKIQ